MYCLVFCTGSHITDVLRKADGSNKTKQGRSPVVVNERPVFLSPSGRGAGAVTRIRPITSRASSFSIGVAEITTFTNRQFILSITKHFPSLPLRISDLTTFYSHFTRFETGRTSGNKNNDRYLVAVEGKFINGCFNLQSHILGDSRSRADQLNNGIHVTKSSDSLATQTDRQVLKFRPCFLDYRPVV